MKKFIFSLIAVFTFLFVNAQSTGLVWKIKSNKIADSTYEIIATTIIEDGWHLYSNNPTIEGLEAPKFVFKLENIIPVSEISFKNNSSTIIDELFDKKSVNVYTGAVELKQTIKLNGFIPTSIKLFVSAYIAKGLEFIPPSEKEIEVSLEGGTKIY